MSNFNKILSDRFVPALLILSLISSLILLSVFSKKSSGSQTVLGTSDPPTQNCRINQCGFCQNCGGPALSGAGGITCGQTSRCRQINGNFSCHMDLDCL